MKRVCIFVMMIVGLGVTGCGRRWIDFGYYGAPPASASIPPCGAQTAACTYEATPIRVYVGTCAQLMLGYFDHSEGADTGTTTVSPVDDAVSDDVAIATVAHAQTEWTANTNQDYDDANGYADTGDGSRAHVVVVCGVSEGTTNLRLPGEKDKVDLDTIAVDVLAQ